MQRLTAAATLIVLFAIGTQAKADDDRAAMAQEQMQQTFEGLELTDEQIEQVKPVLEASVASMQEILLSYGMDPESRPGSACLHRGPKISKSAPRGPLICDRINTF
jgi:hypothetical protein